MTEIWLAVMSPWRGLPPWSSPHQISLERHQERIQRMVQLLQVELQVA